ncbi:diacylglycerol acyltransferase DGAT2 [Histoplasma ohiense]|nr:diacylglycerol acyltransferase DGAT2 [Histoplasma ohiense (nom. inval.)]
MASVAQTAVSTSHDVHPPASAPGMAKNGTPVAPPLVDGNENESSNRVQHANSNPRAAKSKYRHVAAFHSRPRVSCLSRDSETSPSFMGFRNLMALVLIVMNLRLIVENFMKYGVLICIRCHDYRKQDVVLGAILFALVPCHLFVAYIIERAAAHQVKGAIGRIKRKESEEENTQEQLAFRSAWIYVALAHTLNACLCLLVTSYAVYYYVNHPGIGTLCEVHVIVVWLKICSYAFTNRDLRHAALHPSSTSPLPEIYHSLPYPRNITIKNLTYFWLAPTLVYQPVYPRIDRIRWSFVAKRVMEVVGLSVFIWLTSAQYAAPVLRNSLEKIATLDLTSIIERVMKLSTISLIIWLAGFFALFQSFLNALAEVMHFGDREFYTEWWNSPSVGTYWRTWNKPVYHFMQRHIFSPLVGRGWSPFAASVMVFTFSGILHELLVGIPTHNMIGVAFAGMILQPPLIAVTLPLEKMNGRTGKIIGNCVFWVSFCLVGQPLGALLYFFAWQAKYGSVSKTGVVG